MSYPTVQFCNGSIGEQVQREHDGVGVVCVGQLPGQALKSVYPACHQYDVQANTTEVTREFLSNARRRPRSDRVLAIRRGKIRHLTHSPLHLRYPVYDTK
ncbi:hypothetical protein C1Y40_01463 [Mycobacterium talmoniae]|uniref:Uncharacterized protein n=1 Tax=Mycobacterium talmoniae TaxID=1858794 RepID=A0A2S8BNS3_9MYCO|nr:hypothetical protein C1Y40_01463 [Mycobacterium talmoniae]